MKRNKLAWQLWGFAFTGLGGTLLHFLYEWLGKVKWIAPFSGVNESTWEHMKLLFWPMFLFAMLQSHYFRERNDYWCVKVKGILLGLVLIPILFYTYNGVIGKSPDWINIAIFFVSAAVAYFYEVLLFKREVKRGAFRTIPITLLCIIALSFVIFTFKTPEIGIFKDPLTGGFGI